jgi:hypothetical protein
VSKEKINPSDPFTHPTLYVRNIGAGTTTLSSLAPDGSRIAVSSIGHAELTTDGRELVFSAGVYPNDYDLYLRDLVAGTTRVFELSNSSGGFLLSGDGEHLVANFACLHSCSIPPVIMDLGSTTYPFPHPEDVRSYNGISDNGRYLGVGGGRYDRQTGQLDATLPASLGFGSGTLSGNGRFSAFLGYDPADHSFTHHAFLRDALSDAVRQVDVSASGAGANAEVLDTPLVTRNGRYVGFPSLASNLVDNDTNNTVDAFVVDGAVPQPTSASPGQARGAQHVAVVVKGGFMLNTATADFGPGITVESSSIGADGSMRYVVSIAANAATGRRDVRITNPGVLGDGVGTCANCFTVS